MKRSYKFTLVAMMLTATSAMAQTNSSKPIPMSIVTTEQAEELPTVAESQLATKMKQIANLNGMSAMANGGSQFFITSEVSVGTKEVLGGAPARVAVQADVTFTIGDAINKKVYGSTIISAKGVGINDTKAYISAIKMVKPTSPDIKAFVKSTNDKIIKYYNSEGDNIIRQAQVLASGYKYEEALYLLAQIPEACEVPYAKAIEAGSDIFAKFMNDLANKNLAKARAAWNAGQNREAAAEAGQYLAEIAPEAACYPQAEALAQEIAKKVGADEAYERKLVEQQLKRQHESEMANINAWRAIGVAYGENQQPTTYTHDSVWW